MRLRAKVENASTFTRILQSIERLSKKCTIRFSPDNIRIICNNESEGGVVIWSSIKVSTLFSEYRIQSNANNEITMIMSTSSLVRVLKSGTQSLSNAANSEESQMLVKLTKKNDQPCLTFEIILQNSFARGKANGTPAMTIMHDVRVMVIKPTEAALLQEPLCPEPDVLLVLPPLAKLRSIVERYRSMSDVVGISANKKGTLQLTVQTQRIRADTAWNGLTNVADKKISTDDALNRPEVPSSQEDENEDDEESRLKLHPVLVSVKSLGKFLNAHIISTTTMACICARHCIIMYVYIGETGSPGGVLTFYIPAILEPEEGA